MPDYVVTIDETVTYQVTVCADSEEEACQIVREDVLAGDSPSDVDAVECVGATDLSIWVSGEES